MADALNDAAVEATSLIDEIRTPITEASPCGDDVTYDDKFQQLASEINKVGVVSGRVDHEKMNDGGSVFTSSGVDYSRIVEGSRSILRNDSKDLRVASYLVVGLYHTRGLAGLSDGVAALNTLIETYWEDLYPARARARKGAIELLTGRLGDAVASYKPILQDEKPLEQALAGAKKLQALMKEKLADDEPALDGFIHALSECRRRVPGAPSSNAPSTTEKPGSATASPDGEPAAHVQAPREVKSVADTEHLIFGASAFLREKDAANPIPYRLARAWRWGGLLQEPPHQEGKTQLPPPPQQRRDYLRGLHENGAYSTLVREAEVSFQEPPFHFWLDLQRLLLAATEALGASFQQVRDAVLEETAVILRRLPGLSELMFSDGTPFADAQTREWLEVRTDSFFRAEPERDRALVEEQSHLEEAYTSAREQLSTGDLSRALTIMQDGREHDTSQKDRFRRRLYLALLCLRGGQAAIARPVLESLDEEIARRSLDIWDPSLALQVWSNLYACYETLGRGINNPDKQTVRDQASRVFEKICRLDTQFALTFVTKGKR